MVIKRNPENEAIIKNFYHSFAANDVESMVSHYHHDIEFSDPAFGKLIGEDAGNMWRMLTERGKGAIDIQFSNVSATDCSGSADWTARYLFSQTNREVFNKIHAEFEFKDAKIIRHTDTFDFWNWSKQALGLAGILLGWSGFMQNKVRKAAKASLREFASK